MDIENLLTGLFISIALHGLALIIYVLYRKQAAFIAFFSTTATNLILTSMLIIILFNRPEETGKLKPGYYLWIGAGIVSFLLAAMKAMIARNILTRMKDPRNYHINYFGKKVYGIDIVKRGELVAFMASVPFFMFIFAWFVATYLRMIAPP